MEFVVRAKAPGSRAVQVQLCVSSLSSIRDASKTNKAPNLHIALLLFCDFPFLRHVPASFSDFNKISALQSPRLIQTAPLQLP